MITVLIVDDHPLQRLGFRMLLESDPDTEVVGEADNGQDALLQVGLLQPDVVLMDIRMPGLNGIDATRQITASGAASRVLVMTTFDADEYVHDALRAGASGFLLKDARPEEVLSGIRAVAAGDAVIAPALTRRLLDSFGPQPAPLGDPRSNRDVASLTRREREILTSIGLGWTNSEIAERLFLSESTVKTHVGRVLAKVGARDRIQAVIFAYDHGLTSPKDQPPHA